MDRKRKFITLLKIIPILITAALGFVVMSNVWVIKSSKGKLYDNIESVPKNEAGLVLGTSKYLIQGGINPYFKYRMEAAMELFKAGKVDYLIVSGDNKSEDYNEPKQMMEYLVKGGIPKDKIYLDYAGLRTLDSVVRAEKIFGFKEFTIVSQPFHNKRAVFIASQKELNTIGYNAKKVSYTRSKMRMMGRESLARTKAVLDIFLGKKPKFGGPPILSPNS